MLSILKSECYKLLKSKIILLVLVIPFIILPIGMIDSLDLEDLNQWYSKLITINLSYGLLVLPLITGVFAGIICRYEHQAGGWKQLLTLPVTRGRIYCAKYIVLVLLLLVMQILYPGSVYLIGIIEGITDPFPMDIVWKITFGGWIATFPLIALQLWMSTVFKSFAAPFAVNVIFTLPTLLIINSEKFGPYYPWAQPFLMMNIGGNIEELLFIPLEQLLIVVGGSFIVFFISGYIYFQRKTI